MHYTACKSFLNFALVNLQVRIFSYIMDTTRNTSLLFLFYSNLVAAVGLEPTVVYVSRTEEHVGAGDRTCTCPAIQPRNFKFRMSTSSITPAHCVLHGIHIEKLLPKSNFS